MLVTTTPTVDGRRITKYCGVVAGEAILGANVFKDLFAGIRDLVGGRSATYERELQRARDIAIEEMKEKAAALGGNAVVGIDLDYEVLGQGNGMLMVVVVRETRDTADRQPVDLHWLSDWVFANLGSICSSKSGILPRQAAKSRTVPERCSEARDALNWVQNLEWPLCGRDLVRRSRPQADGEGQSKHMFGYSTNRRITARPNCC